MAYEMEYLFNSIKYTSIKPGRNIKAAILMTVALLAGVICLHLLGTATGVLLYGGEQVPAAVEQFANDLSAGVEFNEAAQAFYAELSK